MRYLNTEVVILADDLSRRRIVFTTIDNWVVVDFDLDEIRKSKRHKWSVAGRWSRLNLRENTIARREIPEEAVREAVEKIREQIQFREERILSRF